jgi:outer membrane protein assembly factor BamA
VRIFHEHFLMMLRTLIFLLALGPVVCHAMDTDPQANPIVEGVQCSGNLATSCELIRSQSGIAVGKELDDIQVENARLRLEGLTQFRSVQIHLIKGSRKHWVVVVIDVVESAPITTAFAAGALLQFPLHADETGVIAGRVTNNDLFNSGNALDFAVVAARPIDGNGSSEYSARLEYREPRLFDSHTFFFTAGAFYSQSSFVENFNIPLNVPDGTLGGSSSGKGGGIDFSIGMHIGSYSYATAGYRYLPNANSGGNFLVSDGIFTTLNSTGNNVMLFTLGRNTEDDPSFPTHGWLLHAYDGFDPISHGDFGGVLVRGTWRAGENSYWTFQARPFDNFRSLFDDDLGASLVYSHNFSANTEAGARRARWYVGPGLTNLGHFYGEHYFDVGVKAGVRLETKYLGTVNLYLLATYPVHAGN